MDVIEIEVPYHMGVINTFYLGSSQGTPKKIHLKNGYFNELFSNIHSTRNHGTRLGPPLDVSSNNTDGHSFEYHEY